MSLSSQTEAGFCNSHIRDSDVSSRVRSWIRGLRTEHLLQGRLSQGEITALQNSQKRAATTQFPRKGLVITQSCNNYDPRAGFCPTGQAMALGGDRKYVSLSVSWRRKWQPIPVFLPSIQECFPVFLRILWTEQPGGLLSIGSRRVGHD